MGSRVRVPPRSPKSPRLLGLQADNQGLDLGRQLIGVADRPPGAVVQRLEPVLPVAVKNLVAGFAGSPELPADLGHGLSVEQAGDKAQAFFHHRTRFPRHPHLPPKKSEKCNPCVRYKMSPMSRAAHGRAFPPSPPPNSPRPEITHR